ncbi:hypothetical protein PQQ52_20515 [Paraburkholderia sediminicola]|uniref:hypothetical protein n=1 Tax=Paraburkholderia sediminicola TaxID=458836 RepID=UPI0038BADEF2
MLQSQGHEPDVPEAGSRLVGERVARKPVEVRICQEIKRECELQRTALSRKEAADAEVRILDNILGELFFQAEFVALLKATGFAKMPHLVQQRLLKQACEDRAASDVPEGNTTGSGHRRGRPPDVTETTTTLAGETLSARTIQALSRMTTSRRIAVSNLMRAVDNYTGDFAHALLAATPEDHRAVVSRVRRCDRNRTRRFERIEKRLIGLQRKNHALSAGHNVNLLYLAVCGSYIRSWVQNYDVIAWLQVLYPLHAASLERIAREADDATEPKRAMKLPYARTKTVCSTTKRPV